jgi:hypothetical protein
MLSNGICPETYLIVAWEEVIVVRKEPAIRMDFVQVAIASS